MVDSKELRVYRMQFNMTVFVPCGVSFQCTLCWLVVDVFVVAWRTLLMGRICSVQQVTVSCMCGRSRLLDDADCSSSYPMSECCCSCALCRITLRSFPVLIFIIVTCHTIAQLTRIPIGAILSVMLSWHCHCCPFHNVCIFIVRMCKDDLHAVQVIHSSTGLH